MNRTKHICIYCGKQCKSGYSLGGHIVKCKSNPKLVQLELQRSVGKRHPRKLVEYSLNCEKCGVPYMLSLTQYKYSIGAYRKYCSKSCASSRPHSQQTKYKISATNKGTGGCASTPERQQLRRQRISETCKQNKKVGDIVLVLEDVEGHGTSLQQLVEYIVTVLISCFMLNGQTRQISYGRETK